MTLEHVKEILLETAGFYFKGACVLWAKQAGNRPPPPYATLDIRDAGRTAFPLELEPEDPEECGTGQGRLYQCRSIMEVNLYTEGAPTGAGEGRTGSYANTALSDMLAFSSYLDSEMVTDHLAGKGISVLLMPPVRDLSSLENGTSYRYRAMAEYAVSYFMEADGAYGILGRAVPDAGGGGTQELAGEPIEPIRDVEMEAR